MSGLDKMKSRIFEEAEKSAEELLDQAKKDAEKFGGKGKRQYLCNRKSETDRWS